MTIPVTAIVVTKNEEKRIGRCLEALSGFEEIIVLDSASRDKTAEMAALQGARVENFIWNGQYPKKRQWCLDHVEIRTDWIFFVDADEIVTEELKKEIADLFRRGPAEDGYFIKGQYRMGEKLLRHGLQNNKIALFHRGKFRFPVVDDLDIPGMGEIEGHYQPVPVGTATIGALKSPLLHDALDDPHAWAFRHEKYARWEAGMNARNAWPHDPVTWRQNLKVLLRATRFRPQIMFFLSYVAAGGFLDGRAGLELARRKSRYYSLIQNLNGQASTR